MIEEEANFIPRAEAMLLSEHGEFGRPVWLMASLTRTYSHLGRRADAEALYGELRSRAKREFVSPVFLAVAACATGEQDDAISHAQHANRVGDPALIGIKYWPDLAELREDTRFQEIPKSRGWA
jgi:hypothetical protein